MIRVLTHRGLDPAMPSYFVESSYEAFEDQLTRGYGLEVDVQFTKDYEIVILHDTTFTRLSGGTDTRAIADLTHDELMKTSFSGSHLTDFDELCALFLYLQASGINRHGQLAFHVKGNRQTPEQLDILLQKIHRHHLSYEQFFLFDLTPTAAAYLKQRDPKLVLAASVAHSYDVERYNASVHGTLLTVDEIRKYKNLYDWAWLDEWDRSGPNGTNKRLYTKEVFDDLRVSGFKIALVTPELHASSPALLGGESHPDGIDHKRLQARFAEIVALQPDLMCTDYPDLVQQEIDRQLTQTSDWPRRVRSMCQRINLNEYWKLAKNRVMAWIIGKIEARTWRFFSIRERPIRALDHGYDPEPLRQLPRSAVVIQGPILKTSNFTFETIKLYKKTFPTSEVILSTWDDEDALYLKKCAEEGAIVVTSKKPSVLGPVNTNLQLASTYAGILEAERRGAEYVLKIRTDERMYGLGIMEFLINLVEAFPVQGGFNQRRRIVTLGSNTAKRHPYHFGDLFLFGQIEDMKAYWGVPMLPATMTSLEKSLFNPEVHLAAAFLEKTGRKLKWTIEDSWRAYAEQAVIIDASTLDIYWHKYQRWIEERTKTYQRYARPRGGFSFHEWFNLYRGFSNREIPHDPAAVFRGWKRSSRAFFANDSL